MPLSVCGWDVVMRDIRWSTSVWKCPGTPRESGELIRATCWDEAQQLELPLGHSKTDTIASTHQWPRIVFFVFFTDFASSLLFAPHSLGTAKSIVQKAPQDGWEFVGVYKSLPRLRLLRALFLPWGFPPRCGIDGILKMLAARCPWDRDS